MSSYLLYSAWSSFGVATGGDILVFLVLEENKSRGSGLIGKTLSDLSTLQPQPFKSWGSGVGGI